MAANFSGQRGVDAIFVGSLDSNEKRFIVEATGNAAYAAPEILFNAQADIRETETAVTIRVDVPGFSENDLVVRIAPRRLCITAQCPEASGQQEGKTVYSERRSRRIFRVLDLPSQIDLDLTEATLSGGILEITLLKAADMGKKIPVLAKAARA